MKELIEIIDRIDYNSETGEIRRNDRKDMGGSLDKDGYLIIKILGSKYRANRLAWVKFYNAEPKGVIDHINGNRIDNRICNLRDISQADNVRVTKRKPNKDTGEVGIYIDNVTKGLIAKYTTRINGKSFRFRSLEEAIKFREKNYYGKL